MDSLICIHYQFVVTCCLVEVYKEKLALVTLLVNEEYLGGDILFIYLFIGGDILIPLLDISEYCSLYCTKTCKSGSFFFSFESESFHNSSGWFRTHFVAKASFELKILLPPSAEF
jgi:hypothetical protein